ncbi:MAG TPA: family 16 glycoside hydrolase [Rhodothermales bacterium]
MSRPKPPRLEPPKQQLPVPPPEGAVILFDGTDLSGWEADGGAGPARWTLGDGYFEVAPDSGAIQSKEAFGDVQLHLEWASPILEGRTGQDRGNSGVFLMNRYEVQILDSYESDTYADGQAAAIYGQYPPRFNVTRPPGEWQSYDIYFRRPRFKDGAVAEPARITVVHNGVLVQDNVEILGPTDWLRHRPYQEHADAEPIQLQDHGHKVRFRNIWAIRLPDRPLPPAGYTTGSAEMPSAATLEELAGTYYRGRDPIVVTVRDGKLYAALLPGQEPQELIPESSESFATKETAGKLVFRRDDEGKVTGLVFHLGGAEMPARRR